MNPLRLLVLLVSLPLLLGGCGEKESVTSLKYEIKGDYLIITGCDKKVSGALTIPATIEGKPVTSIGNRAFWKCTSLTSITIPDSVTNFGVGAFEACRNLTSITIPDGVTTIGWYAFGACESLTEITIPDSVTTIGHDTFEECTSLTAVTFLGDAPRASKEVFKDSVPTIYRKPEAKGWGKTFGDSPVKLISEKP